MSSRLELRYTKGETIDKFQQQKTFEWSFRPMLNWMRILGIALETHFADRKRRYWFTTGFGIILFFGNMVRLTSGIYHNVIQLYSEDSNLFRSQNSSTLLWNMFIFWFNEFFLSVGIQLAVMASMILNWQDLVAVLHRMERNQLFDSQHFKRFRRIFEIAFAFIILVFKKKSDFYFDPLNSIFLIFGDKDAILNIGKIVIFRQTYLHHILVELAAIYPSSVGFLFISLGWTVSIMFDTFDQEYIQAHKHSRQQQTNSEINWNQQILKWKRRYFLINNLIHQINRCFSVFLLIFIAGHFARLITTFFYLLTLVNKPSWRLKALLAYELVIMAFHLLSLIYIPHRINRKVIAK